MTTARQAMEGLDGMAAALDAMAELSERAGALSLADAILTPALFAYLAARQIAAASGDPALMAAQP